MRLLLDTNALLWFYLADPQLSAVAQAAIVDPAHDKLVSPASFWEIAIKLGLKKYVLNESYGEFIRHSIVDNGFDILPIEPRHTAVLVSLPLHHRDPFDRLLISQAIVESLSIVSVDPMFDRYPIHRLW